MINLKPYISDYYNNINHERCLNTEKILEKEYGINIDDVLERLDKQKTYIKERIDYYIKDNSSLPKKVKVDNKIYEFFNKVFLFNFNSRLCDIYIKAHMSILMDYVVKNKLLKSKILKFDYLKDVLNDNRLISDIEMIMYYDTNTGRIKH